MGCLAVLLPLVVSYINCDTSSENVTYSPENGTDPADYDYSEDSKMRRRRDGSGLIELNNTFTGEWGGVCSKKLTDEAARVICADLGLGNTGILHPGTTLTAEVSYIADFICGYENTTLDDCSVTETDDVCGRDYTHLAVVCGDLDREADCGKAINDSYYRTTCHVREVDTGRVWDVLECWNSTVLYTVKEVDDMCIFSNICPESDSNYQGCGCPGVSLSNQTCDTLICRYYLSDANPITAIDSSWLCDGYYDCLDWEDESYQRCRFNFTCSEGPMFGANQTGNLPDYYVCDQMADCVDGEDELQNCVHDASVGVICTAKEGLYYNRTVFIDKRGLCDSQPVCVDDQDERRCEEYYLVTNLTCNSFEDNALLVNVTRKERCEFPEMSFLEGYCESYIDQMNCTENNVFYCTVGVGDLERGQEHFPHTAVRHGWVCNQKELCLDGSDEWCHKISETCFVHKHQLCDGENDCPGGSDEKMSICEKRSEKTCQRKYRKEEGMNLTLPVDWLCDGQVDCLDGMDEDMDEWLICGSGDDRKCYPNITEVYACTEGFRCPNKESTMVSIWQLCNYDESCSGAESELCQITKGSSAIADDYVINVNSTQYIPPCLPGLLDQFNCTEVIHDSRTELQTTHKIYVPITYEVAADGTLSPRTESCENIFGEEYVVMVCQGICEGRPQNTSCPIQRVTETSCIGNNLVYVPDSYEPTVQKLVLHNGRYDEDIFVCNNSNCVDKTKVCDLVDDCGDGSDESANWCDNNFDCIDGTPRYIKKQQKCDGTHDCNNENNTDECSPDCGYKEIINSIFLKTCTFLIGACSILVNIYMVVGIVHENRIFHSRAHFMNLSMVCLISLGDFCVGTYLLNVFTVDQLYREDYCRNKYEWLTSRHCAMLGVISTFGTQLSIFTMLCLSVYRTFTLKSMGGRARVTSQHKLCMGLLAMTLIMLASFIAVIPILDFTEDYFTNGLYYKANTLFNKVANLGIHKDFIDKYTQIWNNNLDKHNETALKPLASYTWENVRHFIQKKVFYFTSEVDLEDASGKSLKFYGNDGVCLFKYFVSPNDPQRIYSLTILSINLICFSIISSTYISVILTAHDSANKTSNVKDSRSTQLNTKITLMIITNVLSWVPFGIICLLHTLDKIDATQYYKVSSIILLPINSCVNPIIYSNILVDIFNWIKARLKGKTVARNTAVKEKIELSFASSAARDVKRAVRNSTCSECPTPGRLSTATIDCQNLGRLSTITIDPGRLSTAGLDPGRLSTATLDNPGRPRRRTSYSPNYTVRHANYSEYPEEKSELFPEIDNGSNNIILLGNMSQSETERDLTQCNGAASVAI